MKEQKKIGTIILSFFLAQNLYANKPDINDNNITLPTPITTKKNDEESSGSKKKIDITEIEIDANDIKEQIETPVKREIEKEKNRTTEVVKEGSKKILETQKEHKEIEKKEALKEHTQAQKSVKRDKVVHHKKLDTDTKIKSQAVATSNSVFATSSGLTTLGKELISQLRKDKTLSYDLPFYKSYLAINRKVKNRKFKNLEPKMKKLYYDYMNYLIKGGINWKAFDKELKKLAKKYDYTVAWERYAPPYSAKKILKTAIKNGSFENIFNRVEPTRFKYRNLKRYLIKYLRMPNWKTVGKAPTLKPGMSHRAIPIIRKRLKLAGDLRNCSEPMSSTYYDKCLASAVKRFKIRHGLGTSSTITRATRTELNRSRNYYIKKMRLNLDRIKWTKRHEPKVRIELNIPAFRLYVYDGKDLVTTMRVVTGKPDHPTPVFSDTMTSIVVNPYWNIPQSIVRKELLKHLVKNPYYYKRKYTIYKGWGKNAKKIDPGSVNWKKYLNNKKHIPYNFRQNPGYKNALGKIKFLFPNKYAVYIHDTPSKKLFFKETRAFSHGCMRIQKPRELLKALSLYNSNINVNKLMNLLKTDKNTAVGLRQKIPIDITYLTAFVDDYNNLHFRKDIYGYDKIQLKTYAYNKPAQRPKSQNEKKKRHKKLDTVKEKKAHKKTKDDKYEIIEIGY